jgi:hypothetical protein
MNPTRAYVPAYYYKTAKRRAKETITKSERLKIHQRYKNIKTKSSTGEPRQATGKQFQRSMNGTTMNDEW